MGANHYYRIFVEGGRFGLMEAGKGNRLQSKASVNRGLIEAVALPASDNLFTKAGNLERHPR
jgi:hypothetical protein